MTDDLKQRLRELSTSRKPYSTGAHGQMVGMESYRIVANGFALECIDEAADRIEQIEAERDELKADAMRYRWLKIHGLQRAWISLGTDCDGENFVDFKCEFKVPEPLNLPYEDDEGLEWADKDFDSAIDAAIAKGEKA